MDSGKSQESNSRFESFESNSYVGRLCRYWLGTWTLRVNGTDSHPTSAGIGLALLIDLCGPQCLQSNTGLMLVAAALILYTDATVSFSRSFVF